MPTSGVRPAEAIWLSAYAGNAQGAGVVTGFAEGGDAATSAHGSITRAREVPGESTNLGASSLPVPSVDMKGTCLPLDQNQSWCPRNTTLPVVVSKEGEPDDRSVAVLPVDVFCSVIVVGPVNVNFRAVVGTWPL